MRQATPSTPTMRRMQDTPGAAAVASTVASWRRALAQQRDDAIARFRANPRPEPLLHALRRATDQAIRKLICLHRLPPGAALAAVGGYGRGELYPHSDVDLLVLLRTDPRPEDTEAIAALIAQLWDLGLDLSHSVRTIAQCRQQASLDVTVQTALLEARWLAGNRRLVRQLAEVMRADLDPSGFFQAKRVEMQQRHAHYQNTAYALEPNCKESPGGLRDLQIIQWLAQAAGLGATWHAIAASGLLTTTELRALQRAERAFKRLRIELHVLAGRREDRLLFDLQPRLAEVYGFRSTRTRRASELLMQRYYWAARVVSQFHTILLQHIEERLFAPAYDDVRPIDDDFTACNNRLAPRAADGFARKPSLLLRAFLVMQQHAELQGMTAQCLHAMWHARLRIDQAFRQNPEHRALFIQILQQPRGVVHALRRMSLLNILPRYLPVFRRVVGQMQHDLFHVYTVDEHSLMVIRNLRRFTLPEYAQEHPLASECMAGCQDVWLLYIAALFHDIAKGRGGDHSALGARDARRFCVQHGLAADDTDLVVFLVRQHLALSLTAQKRDLGDARVIRAFTALVGTQRRLRALYLLTVADIRGTSPKVWNAWKGKLLDDLYLQTLQALGRGHLEPADLLAQRKAAAMADVRRQGLDAGRCEAFWAQLDMAYFLRHDARDIAWQTMQLHDQAHALAPVVKARRLSAETLQILVYVQDRKDLFASICRYFDEHLFNIQDARIHTTRSGWALDTFIVLLPVHGDAAVQLEKTLEDGLTQHLRAHKAMSKPHAMRRGSRRARAFPIVPQVELLAEDAGEPWRLSLTATDRPGLLYQLAQVFARHDVNLQMAKIMTLGDRIEDVFILQGDALMQTPQRFEREILHVLSDMPQPGERSRPDDVKPAGLS